MAVAKQDNPDLDKRLDILDEQVKTLVKALYRANRFADAFEVFGRYFGLYKHENGLEIPAVITQVYQVKKTVDIIIFDANSSGGSYELHDVKLGTARSEMRPFMWDTDDDGDNANPLMASES